MSRCPATCSVIEWSQTITCQEEDFSRGGHHQRNIFCFNHITYVHWFVRSPFRSYVLRMFLFSFSFSQLTFSDVCKPIFSKLFHMTWLYSKKKQKKRCYADILKVPPNKNGAKNPKFRPISRLIATYYAPSLVMWKEYRKSKTTMFISDY